MGVHVARNIKRIDKNIMLDAIDLLKDVAKESKLELNQVVEIYRISTYNRFIDAIVDNGDYEDDQNTDLCRAITDAASTIADAFDKE